MSPAESKLFKPLTIGRMKLSNRLAMAPLTRFRADKDGAPLPIVAEYYKQRSSYPGTLLVTEATFISPQASGYPHAPGIFTDKQIAAWKKVVADVHAEGGHIYLQLWHLGRASKAAELAKLGLDVVSASDIPFEGGDKPRPLTEAEIESTVADYAKAAKNAVEGAGFDGVEIHGANGYLIDQFIQDVSNNRTDKYGGSIENRSRFALEVTKAVVDAVGADRTAIRLSPWSDFQGMHMKEPQPQFTHLITELQKFGISYLHLVESRVGGNADQPTTDKNDFALDLWKGTKDSAIFLAGGFTPELALEAVDEEYANYDIGIVFGRYFISTPDLVYRIKNGIKLNEYDRNSFYAPEKAEGYTDYPFSKEYLAEKSKL